MENCLVTKLKGIVDNNTLRKLGELRFSMAQPGSFSVYAANDDSFQIKILTSGVTFTAPQMAAGTTEQTVPATAERNFTVSGPCEIAIYNKYALKLFTNSYYIAVDVDELSGTSKLTTVFFGDYRDLISGSLKGLKDNVNIKSIAINSSNFKSDLEDLMTSSTLYNLNLEMCDIGGDIANLSRLSGLVDFKLNNMPRLYGNVSVFANISNIRDITFVGSLGVTGSISSFANHSSLRNLQIYGTSITGTLGDLTNVPALKGLYLPTTVTWTDAQAAVIDPILQANGGSISPSTGHYFGGGTHVES